MHRKTFCTRGGVILASDTPAPPRRTANKVTIASVIRCSNTQRNGWEERTTMIATETKDRARIVTSSVDILAEF
jgi:hypothetical protein